MAIAAEEGLGSSYDKAFYDSQRNGSLVSARAILPWVRDLVRPSAVVDVGCGLGTWLSAWGELGVTDRVGVDGPWVETSRLLIPQDLFLPRDLSKPLTLGRSFDLAMSLEVAEHLHGKYAPTFVRSLCQLAPVVLFSAAIPKQQGEHHVNERWPSYWRDLFAAEGYVMLDPIRPRILHDEAVEYWYRQNIFLLVRSDLHTTEERYRNLAPYSETMTIVATEILNRHMTPSLREALALLPSSAAEAARRRWNLVRSRVLAKR